MPLEPQSRKVVDAMLPHPVDAFGGLVSQTVTAEVAAQKKDEPHTLTVGRLELVELRGLFLAALVGIREVARRLGLNADRQAILPRLLGLDHHIDRNVYLH